MLQPNESQPAVHGLPVYLCLLLCLVVCQMATRDLVTCSFQFLSSSIKIKDSFERERTVRGSLSRVESSRNLRDLVFEDFVNIVVNSCKIINKCAISWL
jgi:hypothetical protein